MNIYLRHLAQSLFYVKRIHSFRVFLTEVSNRKGSVFNFQVFSAFPATVQTLHGAFQVHDHAVQNNSQNASEMKTEGV